MFCPGQQSRNVFFHSSVCQHLNNTRQMFLGGSFLGDMELTRTPHYEYNEKSNLQHINSKSAGSPPL